MDEKQFKGLPYAQKMKLLEEIKRKQDENNAFRRKAMEDMSKSVTDPRQNIEQKQQRNEAVPAESIQKKLLDLFSQQNPQQNQVDPEMDVKLAALQRLRELQMKKTDEDENPIV